MLNKLDAHKSERQVLGLIRKLTCGFLGGAKQVIASKHKKSKPLFADTYLKRKEKEYERNLRLEAKSDNEVCTYIFD